MLPGNAITGAVWRIHRHVEARRPAGGAGDAGATGAVRAGATSATPAGPGVPRHRGREAAAGLVWLPRLIDKRRRVLEGEAAGRDLLGEYLFGVNDPADAELLRFLGVTNEGVLAMLLREPDDARAAAELVRRSGRTPAECDAWSRRCLRWNGPFLAMMDADEGRRAPGVGTTALRLVYNYVIMAPYYPIYRRLELRRLARSVAEAAGQAPRRSRLGWRVPVVLAGGAVLARAAWRRLAR